MDDVTVKRVISPNYVYFKLGSGASGVPNMPDVWNMKSPLIDITAGRTTLLHTNGLDSCLIDVNKKLNIDSKTGITIDARLVTELIVTTQGDIVVRHLENGGRNITLTADPGDILIDFLNARIDSGVLILTAKGNHVYELDNDPEVDLIADRCEVALDGNFGNPDNPILTPEIHVNLITGYGVAFHLITPNDIMTDLTATGEVEIDAEGTIYISYIHSNNNPVTLDAGVDIFFDYLIFGSGLLTAYAGRDIMEMVPVDNDIDLIGYEGWLTAWQYIGNPADRTQEFEDDVDILHLNASYGDDLYEVDFTGEIGFVANVYDSGAVGTDTLTIKATSNPDTILSRQYYIANIAGEETDPILEIVNYDESINGHVALLGYTGDDRIVFDDNCTITIVDGAEGDDFFQIGQLYDPASVIDDTVTYDTMRDGTVWGLLSRGISAETAIHSGDGDDTFVVYHNDAVLNLYGGAGNDTFIFRSWNGDPANARVNIDGGDGCDKIVIMGTESVEVYVITATGVYCGGLNIHYTATNEEILELNAMENDDILYIQSTDPSMVTSIYGGLGNDSITICGDITETVDTTAADEYITPIQVHTIDLINGPLALHAAIPETADLSITANLVLPNETVGTLADVIITGDESEMTDSMFVFNDDDTSDNAGTLDAGNISGFGTSDAPTMNQGTSEVPDYIVYNAGIDYDDFEIVEMLLGTGNDGLTIENTSSDSITAIHGGGGSDNITINNRDGLLVVYGDTAQSGIRYSSDLSTSSIHANGFTVYGDDTIDASACPKSVVLYGSAGNDTLYGSMVGDHLAGGTGKDVIHGQGGDDHIYGDSGLNVLLKDHELTVDYSELPDEDTLYGNEGEDILFGDHGIISQTEGTLRILTTGNVTKIETTSVHSGANDTINGDEDADVIFGGLGCDTLTGNAAADILIGDNGVIVFAADNNMETLDSIQTTDPSIGNDDSIFGNEGNDRILAGNGNDTIHAGDGNNLVIGDNGSIEYTATTIVVNTTDEVLA